MINVIEETTAKYLEYMIHSFMNGLETLLEIDGLSDEELETIYALGYNYFTYGKYEAARDIFELLTAYAPYTPHYWRALGAVNQQLEDYKPSIEAYDMAIIMDEKDVVSYVYRGETQILSGNIEEGLRDLDTVIKIGSFYPEWQSWVERATLLLKILKPKQP